MCPISPQHNDDNTFLRAFDTRKDGQPPSSEDFNLGNSRVSENSSYITPERKRLGKSSNSHLLSSSLGGTPNQTSNLTTKRRTSTAAQAAITAGMTQPPSASEIDFDIHCPPLEPVLPPSSDAVCTIPSNVGAHDVLCGRGGGTNTQIGNRRFRSLVQEFQPTYLLCRRKEKPLIARTIVLIIRNRGGRFLKKDETSSMLFEVGDEKAGAKTSQALREGLEVRAAKSNTLLGKKKIRKKRKKIQLVNERPSAEHGISINSYVNSTSRLYDITLSDSSPGQKQVPSQIPRKSNSNESGYYYYRCGCENPNYHYISEQKPLNTPSPPRKRLKNQPIPHVGSYHYAIPTKCYPNPHPPAFSGGNHLQSISSVIPAEEDTSVWAMDFSPPKSRAKEDEDGNNTMDTDIETSKTKEKWSTTGV
jgi:hypothetical protein